MSTVNQLERVLLSQDDAGIANLRKGAQRSVASVNAGFRSAEDFLGRKLTDEELQQVSQQGFHWVLEEIRKDFPFKNASDDFNLEAMGKKESVASCKAAMRDIPTSWDIEIVDGVANLTSHADQQIVEQCKKYTNNQAQNDALVLAKRMAKDMNKLVEMKVLDRYDVSHFCNKIALLKAKEVVVQKSSSPKIPDTWGYKFDVNIDQILNVKESGEYRR